MFIKVIRKLLGAIILFLDKVFTPSSINRSTEEQEVVDNATKNLKLYQFNSCPFCVKVRRQIKRLNLNIEIVEVKPGTSSEADLINLGGKRKVPCLRITKENSDKWLYESNDIIKYLEKEYF